MIIKGGVALPSNPTFFFFLFKARFVMLLDAFPARINLAGQVELAADVLVTSLQNNFYSS